MKIKSLCIYGLISMLLGSMAQAYQSSHMKSFQILQCSEKLCLEASGNVALMSLSQDALYASNVKLEMRSKLSGQAQIQTCSEFRFNLISQFLMCDNRDVPGEPTITIDSRFQISKYPSFLKKVKS